ncbi:hypothetical protein GCM10018790_15350 [Kitasatospora xanthocidica]|nr:hypothetical protein GCM10018790_15350 [Kitasatospora xanthocidica]
MPTSRPTGALPAEFVLFVMATASGRPPAGYRHRLYPLTLTERDQYLVLFTAPPGSPGAEALALLAVLGARASDYPR